jgi:hypothetical protein
VAKQGHLVAYRLNENMLLDENSFVIV